jgi:hypothetical protein
MAQALNPSSFHSYFQKLQTPSFTALSSQEKFNTVCQTIYHFLEELPEHSFALPSVLNFIHEINTAHLLDSPLGLHNFEMWLNALCHISEDMNSHIRTKIAGRKIPRDEYQIYFPLTSGKPQWGSHIVTAHSSPDLDTAVASFWSWLDAFAARVGTGLHYWNVPGSRLSDHDARVFHQFFGQHLFDELPKGRSMLTLQAIDLMTTHTLLKFEASTRVSTIDSHQFDKGIILVDEEGCYQGDWRRNDVEGVRQVTSLLSSVLRFFEGKLHSKLISLFAKPDLSCHQAKEALLSLFETRMDEAEAFQDYTQVQKELFKKYLQKILEIPEGYLCSFSHFASCLSRFGVTSLEHFFNQLIELFESSQLFNGAGHFIEDRPLLLNQLEKSFHDLETAINAIRSFNDTLGICIRIKHEVLRAAEEYVSSKADVEEVKRRMNSFSALSVVYQEKTGKLIPIGVIYADTLKRKSLGTVSLRDFSNRDEVKIADYLEIISVVDHHKTDIRSLTAPVAVISNTQSCNTLLAEMQLSINERYSLCGQSLSSIQEHIRSLSNKKELSQAEKKQLLRLMQRENIFEQNKNEFFVHPERERLEYLCYLYAIFDDTDLLAKAGARDLRIVVQLLNRLKTLEKGLDDICLSLEDLEHQSNFIPMARERILKYEAMYELYSQFYGFKESSIKEQILLCQQRKPNTLFSDTKTQNGCARVGQIKLTSPLVAFFHDKTEAILQSWLHDSRETYHVSHEIDLHLQMISTIAGAQDVYSGQTSNFSHQDMLWIWSSMTPRACEHLIHFLRGFRYAKEVEKLTFDIEVFGKETGIVHDLLKQNFTFENLVETSSELEGALMVFKFQAGMLNSRKAAISPFLPVQQN